MATQGQTNRESFIAGADLSAKQFTFVIMNTVDRTVVVAGNAAAADGIVINKPASGDAATVDANGAGVVAATSDVIVGKVVDAAAAGGYATIDFFRGGNVSA